MHNPTAEAERWWMQALDDRAFVRAMAREGRFFDKACFNAQQAAEKALKACLYAEGRREVIGHALLEFVRDLAQRHPDFAACGAPAARLDRHYIPTRYPNGLPGGSPFQSYSAEDLTSALADLEAVLGAAQRFLRARGVASSAPD